jgi:hypothetical protein
VCGDGVRYLTVTDPNNDSTIEQCDAGPLDTFGVGDQAACPPADTWGSITGIPGDCGDGYYDEIDFCANDCMLQCAPPGTGHNWWTDYKSDPTYCVFVAEPHGDLTPGVFDPVTGSFDDAEDHCDGFGIGAHLVKLTSTTQNTQLYDLAIEALDDLEQSAVGDEDGFIEEAIFDDLGIDLDEDDGEDDENEDPVTEEDDFDTGVNFWLGLHDEWQREASQDPPGDWFWIVDDSALDPDLDRWATDQPNDGGSGLTSPGTEDCAVMFGVENVDEEAVNVDEDNDEGDGPQPEQEFWNDQSCSITSTLFFCEFPMGAASPDE